MIGNKQKIQLRPSQLNIDAGVCSKLNINQTHISFVPQI